MKNDLEFRGSDQVISQNSQHLMVNPEQMQAREALREINSIPSVYNTLNSQNMRKVNEYPASFNA